MKTLNHCTFLLSMLWASSLFGQDAPVYEKVYFKPAKFENEYVKVEIDNIVSLPKETKFRMSITNKTADYLVYNSEESNFDIPDQDVRAKDKSFMIDPASTKNKVFRAFGTDLNTITNFQYVCEGFYLLKPQDVVEADQFRLPAASNDFTAGHFELLLAGIKKASAKTELKFNVTYKGDHYGFVHPSKISVLMPDGNAYATTNSKDAALILTKAESGKFTASWDRMPGGSKMDMQMVEMFVQFNNVFVEAVPEKIKGDILQLDWDDALTEGKK